jgi:lipopolysaccharide heptosyltransferase I
MDPSRILIIKPSAIGDVVHALPILNLVRKRWPAARIDWLVTPACAGLLENHPQLDEVILFDRKRFSNWWRSPRLFRELRRFTRGLRDRNFDLVLDLQGLFRSGWLARKTKAPRRVGFANAREFAWVFYNQRVKVGTPEQHAISRYLKIAQAIGCGDAPVKFVFGTTDADRAHVRDLLHSALSTRHSALLPPYAVILPGTNWETKRWPADKFAALIQPLKDRFGLATVLAGGGDALALADQIPGAINLATKTTLNQLVALLQSAALVVANDSGPMHIAAALGRPLVTPFGPTNPIRTGPYNRPETVLRLGLPCSPCYSRTCGHQSCLKWLDPDTVLNLASEQMGAPLNPEP